MEGSLFRRCFDYHYEEEVAQKVTETFYDDKTGKMCKKESLAVVKVNRTLPPDVHACKAVLAAYNEKYRVAGDVAAVLSPSESKLRAASDTVLKEVFSAIASSPASSTDGKNTPTGV